MNVHSVAQEFTKYPAGRHKASGSTSGEEFRERFLIPYLQRGESVTIDLDGTIGYGSSFLEEAFGGAVRVLGLTSPRALELINLRSSDSALIEEIREYIHEAGSLA